MPESKPHQYRHPHPAVAVDLVIFTLRAERLQVLLVERGVEPFKGRWALPGGFVRIEEDLGDAAVRELKEETGLSHAYLEQVGVFGKPDRDPRERVISAAYFAILPSDKVALQAGTDAHSVDWHPAARLPELAFDHAQIVQAAQLRLIDKISRTTLALEFLPAEFTLTELQQVFEAVRLEQIDKRNFRKWATSFEFIRPTGRVRRGGHRPATLYRVSNKALMSMPAGRLESVPGEPGGSDAVREAAYRQGYEDAIAALHHRMLESERAALKALEQR